MDLPYSTNRLQRALDRLERNLSRCQANKPLPTPQVPVSRISRADVMSAQLPSALQPSGLKS